MGALAARAPGAPPGLPARGSPWAPRASSARGVGGEAVEPLLEAPEGGLDELARGHGLHGRREGRGELEVEVAGGAAAGAGVAHAPEAELLAVAPTGGDGD